jgi:hypothetical protein
MQRVVIEELYRELEATDEGYVRRRFLTGGYAGWKSKHVKQWLDAQDTARAERRATWMTRWTMVAAVGAVGAVVVAIAIPLLHK